MTMTWSNHALQRTRHGVVVCNPCVPCAGSLSLVVRLYRAAAGWDAGLVWMATISVAEMAAVVAAVFIFKRAFCVGRLA